MKAFSATVYVVDDDAAIRSSLARLLRIEGFNVQSFSLAEEFLALPAIKRPACLILDVRMPGLSGLEVQDICARRGLGIAIVFITGHGEIPMSVEAMKKGAIDFLEKPYDNDALLRAVAHAIEKNREHLKKDKSTNQAQRCVETLSERERAVLLGVIKGMLNKQIALKLGITEKTVKVHRASVMQKMKATSVPHLVRLAGAAGLDGAVGPKSN